MIPANEVPHDIGKHVLLIGPANYGEYNTPFMIESPKDAERSFSGKLGKALSFAHKDGSKLFGMRIVDADLRSTYMALEEAYKFLIGKPYDWVVPLVTESETIIGNSPRGHPEGFASQLARFCHANTSLLSPTLGLIQILNKDISPSFAISPPESIPFEWFVALTPTTSLTEDREIPLASLIASSIASFTQSKGLSGLGIEIPGEVRPLIPKESDLIKTSSKGVLLLHPSIRRSWSIYKPTVKDPAGPSLTSMRIVSNCLWRIKYTLKPLIGEPQTDLSYTKRLVDKVCQDDPWVESFSSNVKRSGFHGQIVELSLQVRNEVNRIDVVGRSSRA